MVKGRSARISLLGGSPFQATVLDYAHNLLLGTSLRHLSVTEIHKIESVTLYAETVLGSGRRRTRQAPDLESQRLHRRLQTYLRNTQGESRPPSRPSTPVDENLTLLASLLGLDETEQGLLAFLLALQSNPGLREATSVFGDVTLAGAATLLAAATTLPEHSLVAALGRKGRLVPSGIVTIDEDDTYELHHKLSLKTGILDAVLTPGLDQAELLARFLPEAEPSPLNWSDVEHLQETATVTRDILTAALRARRPGVNVLFYGETGTGKTALARLIAQGIGVKLLVAGRADSSGKSATATERLSSLLLGHRLLGQGAALLLFDELEDLFNWDLSSLLSTKSRGTAQMSKQWFNDLLETNPVPTIWITNDTSGIDPAFLRRFSYALEFRALGLRQRARILTRHLDGDSKLSPADIDSIAERYAVSPAQLGSAVATARLLAGGASPDRPAIERVLAPVAKVVTGSDPAQHAVFDVAGYRMDALHASEDLSALADRLADWKPGSGPGVSLCLYGPPGTGKSEYVKYLAHRMGRPIVHKRASDILSPWVGATEQRIAEAFREAETEDAVLLFDEVDSFLRDRGAAVRSWEVTEVNEFLQQLECFRGVVACTTNLWRNIDEASLRRFVFKIEFRFLKAEQVLDLFQSVFAGIPLSAPELEMVRTSLARLSNLAPGDFAAVARREKALRSRSTAAELVAALAAEVRVKPGVTQPIGFGP